MGPPSYMRSVVDRNVIMRRMTLSTFSQNILRLPFVWSTREKAHFPNVLLPQAFEDFHSASLVSLALRRALKKPKC